MLNLFVLQLSITLLLPVSPRAAVTVVCVATDVAKLLRVLPLLAAVTRVVPAGVATSVAVARAVSAEVASAATAICRLV